MSKDILFMDTIAAIATPPGEGSVAILRLSGPDSIPIVARLVKRISQPLSEAPSHTIHHGFLYHPTTHACLDEVLVTIMRSPRTFTREDVVEIGCHGGAVVTKMVLEALLAAGARLADPGEFTKRAFLHGRIDLTQAEAIMDLIHARTEKVAQAALVQHQGHFSEAIHEVRETLLVLLAHIAVTMDYPEYDVDEVVDSETLQQLQTIGKRLVQLLSAAQQGERLQAGVRVALIGRPNVGKSSILNILSGSDKAIVSSIEGTTRDIIEVNIVIEGIPFLLIDTAGLRETTDLVEKLGVDRARRALEQSDVVILVLDGSQPLSQEEQYELRNLQRRPDLVVVNKQDLMQKLNIEEGKKIFSEGEENRACDWLSCSVSQQQGIEELRKALVQLVFSDTISPSSTTSSLYLCNLRQLEMLRYAQESLQTAEKALREGMSLDVVEADIRLCWEHLGEIVGATVKEDLLDSIFSRFCLGK